jgi:hypothetical protein
LVFTAREVLLHAGWAEEVTEDAVVASLMLHEQACQFYGYLRLDLVQDPAGVVQR